MFRTAYLLLGFVSLALGAVGALVPLLPTVPFVLLAAFCFARSSERLEGWLTAHPTFGPHIRAWRLRGAISRRGKLAAIAAFAVSIVVGFAFLTFPWSFAPLAAGVVGGSWIISRPDA